MRHDHSGGDCVACRWNRLTPRERERLLDARYEFEQELLAEADGR